MAGITMQIEGLEGLTASLDGWSTNFVDFVTSQMQEIGQSAFDTMEGDSPVDTGFLQSCWSFTPEEIGFTIANDCEYVSFVEFGHSTRGGGGFVPGQNWIMPAYEQMRADIQALMEQIGAG